MVIYNIQIIAKDNPALINQNTPAKGMRLLVKPTYKLRKPYVRRTARGEKNTHPLQLTKDAVEGIIDITSP